jgi:hypothetical protein
LKNSRVARRDTSFRQRFCIARGQTKGKRNRVEPSRYAAVDDILNKGRTGRLGATRKKLTGPPRPLRPRAVRWRRPASVRKYRHRHRYRNRPGRQPHRADSAAISATSVLSART